MNTFHERLRGVDYKKTDMTFVTARCPNGHTHFNLSVANVLARPEMLLSMYCNKGDCKEPLSVVEEQQAFIPPPKPA